MFSPAESTMRFSGSTAVRNSSPIPKAEWTIEIDLLPAFQEIIIPFLTVEPLEDIPIGLTDLSSKRLENYLAGTLQYPTKGGWQSMEIVMPILFDRTNRTMRSLAPTNTYAGWQRTQRESWP